MKSEKKRFRINGNKIAPVLMLTPATIFLIVCSIYPFIWIFRYICYDYNGFTATFTGTRNFTRMLNDKTFWASVGHTFEYAAYKLIFIIPLSLLLAVLLNARMRGSNLFRGVYFMPTIISTSISGMIFGFIFATQNGILNEILMQIHLISTPIPWLNSVEWVMGAVTILAIWGGFGNYMLYFTTGMNGISEDVYESAKIDGANSIQVLRRITIPLIMPAVTICVLISLTFAFKLFDIIMVFTKGGPANSTVTVAYNIYREAFTNSNYGMATAKSLILVVFVLIVTAIQLKITKSREVEQ